MIRDDFFQPATEDRGKKWDKEETYETCLFRASDFAYPSDQYLIPDPIARSNKPK